MLGEGVAGQADRAPHRRLLGLGRVGRRGHPVDGGEDAAGVGGEALDLVGRVGRGVHADELVGLLGRSCGPGSTCGRPPWPRPERRCRPWRSTCRTRGPRRSWCSRPASWGVDVVTISLPLSVSVGARTSLADPGVEELDGRVARDRWCRPCGSAGSRRRRRRRCAVQPAMRPSATHEQRRRRREPGSGAGGGWGGVTMIGPSLTPSPGGRSLPAGRPPGRGGCRSRPASRRTWAGRPSP